ncbi:hypothetical protein ABB37_05925 [Leptomonas pyrrhocoris]|uniref:Uncharacterized protein n=1 Tax=Leptomonas pyrrhocoris TaxID=157538 RepID=A0A0M9FZ21_LEPPY|nr:hypothetical protein ABB37_05925 [Leptomonas pyrrhocoris]KPA78847.1 hypothetical protein ABB37_05925 [Leptomonas pyrrhocoris]|eukprot:XP_015657286.1 hypothetical protein ABB37_05925 [Leptomonas pyrrhocoris]
MASPTAIGIGVGVALGVLVVVSVVVIVVGLCTSNTRTRDFTRERERRVERVRERHQQEQEQWRERRLRDVVLLLIERGEAVEGVPLAFQLPNRPEVPARRALRNHRGQNTQRQELEIELANEDENGRLDAAAQEIARKPLTELLANGRPEEAEPGPDVMQLLLDGQELQQHTSSDGDDDYLLDEETSASVTPSPILLSGRTSRIPSCPPTPQPQPSQPSSLANPVARRTPPSTTTAEGDGAENPDAAEIEARTAAALRAEQQRREAREAALLQELRRERRRKRRKTAEEVYGEPVDYLPNPENDFLDRTAAAEAAEEAAANAAPQSPLWRFLSPLTPFRGNRSHSKKSAFADRVPEGSTTLQDTRGSSGAPASPRKPKPSGRSPF